MKEFEEREQVKKKVTKSVTPMVPLNAEEIKGNNATNTTKKPSKEQIINQAFKFHSKGNISEAAKYYQYFINKGFLDHRVFTNYGVILRDLGKLKEAEIVQRKAIELKPDFVNALNNLGLTLKDLGKLKEAEIVERKAIDLNPDFAEAHSNLGMILIDLCELKEAEISTRKAIELKPDLEMAHYNLATILQELGKLEEAEISTRKAIELKPIFPEAYNNLGLILKELGKLEEAEIAQRKAIEVKADYAISHYNLGLIFKELGKFEQMIESFIQASHYEPKNPKYYAMKGIKVSDFYRESLSLNKNLMKIINIGDWPNSQKLLSNICHENPRYTRENVKEFIKLWCDFSQLNITQTTLNKIIPIFLNLIIIGERNEDLNKLKIYIFENFNLNSMLEIVDKKDRILIMLSYCEYKFLKKDYSEAEFLATKNIKSIVRLIKDKQTEDLGWLITRRSLSLFRNKALGRKNLQNLINQLSS